jgi:glucose-6-phosphate isomerase
MTARTRSSRITLDFNGMTRECIGPGGISPADIKKIYKKISAAARAIKQKRDDGVLGFMYLPYDAKSKEEVKKAAETVRGRFENLVVVGSGGAALGAAALKTALKHPLYNMLQAEKRKGPRMFVIDNPGPDSAGALFDVIDPKKTFFNFVSKSGSTPETAAMLKIMWKKIEASCGREKAGEHVALTTDRETGSFRAMVNRLGLMSFPVPGNVSGRFTILSAAGLFAAACIGINIDELLKGAAFMDSLCASENVWRNPAYMMAVLHYLSDVKSGRKNTVFMPYAPELEGITAWFSQMWAESTGKRLSKDGRVVNTGLTPVAARGPADQHSQLQLYMEGPDDKTVNFIRVHKKWRDEKVPAAPPGEDGNSYLAGRSMSELMQAGLDSARAGLALCQRPSLTLNIPEISEFTVGQLVYMLEAQAAFLVELYGISAADKPGVELGREIVSDIMGKKPGSGIMKKPELPAGKKYII